MIVLGEFPPDPLLVAMCKAMTPYKPSTSPDYYGFSGVLDKYFGSKMHCSELDLQLKESRPGLRAQGSEIGV